MELHKAIQQIIKAEGRDVLTQPRLVNILSDLQAYQGQPAAKYIIDSMITDGYMQKLLQIGKWDSSSERLVTQFVQLTGFQHDLVSRIFQSVACGLSWKKSIEVADENNNSSKLKPSKNQLNGNDSISKQPKPSKQTENSDIVSVRGTVSIDSTSELDNLYEIARRAANKGDNANAAKYFGMILLKDPLSWEAEFYTTYYEAMTCTIAEISLAADKIINNLTSTLELLTNSGLPEKEIEQIINEKLTPDIFGISNMMHEAALSSYAQIEGGYRSQFSSEYMGYAFDATTIILTWGEILYSIDANKYKSAIGTLWFSGIEQLGASLNTSEDSESSSVMEDVCRKYEDKIKAINPTYEKRNYKAKSGCYIATSIYGSYDCPEVWTLRRFRDNILGKTFVGKAFIKTYYAISPTLVRMYGKANWFRAMWKPILDKLVLKLQGKGIESTPYEDKN